ncbi:hypothetical protein NX059_005458 [Plenodomus lindquistii]|nr:hypothetical protein NX059_005458 [Plenodomus lindquistii]
MTDLPASLSRAISPPPPRKRRKISTISKTDQSPKSTPTSKKQEEPPENHPPPTLAAVESGKAKLQNHLSYFQTHLSTSIRPLTPGTPRLALSSFTSLYIRNSHPHGHAFVIHQHNHPRAGVHYDLRLQFSETSSLSFAIPKGLPGNPNSRSIGRLAVETRVHNYWNHLIESAGWETGSLLVWEAGVYGVLPRKMGRGRGRGKSGMMSPMTSGEEEEESSDEFEEEGGLGTSKKSSLREKQENENQKLISAFQSRYIRLRLHGTRLPQNYTITMRLLSNAIVKTPAHRRRKRTNKPTPKHRQRIQTSSSSDTEPTPPAPTETQVQNDDNLDTDTEEDAQTRANNAYPGSTNNIGSIHQRHWFLQLDGQNSGFVLDKSGGSAKGKGTWVRGEDGGGFEPFLVRGRDVERSIVTGRLAGDVESDEGLVGFVGRGGWVGVYY